MAFEELKQRLDRRDIGLQLEDLRADVSVQPDQAQVPGSQDLGDGTGREPVLEAEPELGIEPAGLDI